MANANVLNIVFAGTPQFAVPSLFALIQSKHRVVCVYTQPDRKAGRGQKLSPSPIKQLAQSYELPIYQPHSLRSAQAHQILEQFDCDLMVVVAYGLLLPKVILEIPRLGCINVHASLLPRWRGAAPIQHALLAGDKSTGISIMQMDAGLDTGPILNQVSVPITEEDNAASLHECLSHLGSQALINTLSDLVTSQVVAHDQDERQATYAHKLTKQQACINWQHSALQISLLIRAFCLWPIAFTYLNGKLFRIHKAKPLTQKATASPGTIIYTDKAVIDVATGEGVLRLQQLQFAGKKAMNTAEVLKSRRDSFKVGTQLG